LFKTKNPAPLRPVNGATVSDYYEGSANWLSLRWRFILASYLG